MYAYLIGFVIVWGSNAALSDIQISPIKQVLEAQISSYSALETCKGQCTMASGKNAYIGAVACPRSIELGGRVFIDGKLYICEDRTHWRFDGRFDIFTGYDERAYINAINYGLKKQTIYVLAKSSME